MVIKKGQWGELSPGAARRSGPWPGAAARLLRGSRGLCWDGGVGWEQRRALNPRFCRKDGLAVPNKLRLPWLLRVAEKCVTR